MRIMNPGVMKYYNMAHSIKRKNKSKRVKDSLPQRRHVGKETYAGYGMLDVVLGFTFLYVLLFSMVFDKFEAVAGCFQFLFRQVWKLGIFSTLLKTFYLASTPLSACLRRMYVGIYYPTLIPQSGYSTVDPYIREITLITCLIETLRGSKTRSSQMAAVTMYLQAHTRKSLLYLAYETAFKRSWLSKWETKDGQTEIGEILEEAFGPASLSDMSDELLDEQDSSPPEDCWGDRMDLAFTNWKDFRHSNQAKKFTNLINVVVSAGLCSSTNVEFKLGNVHLFSPIVTKRQLAAGDVFEAFYEAAQGFIKGGYRVYQTGEVSSFYLEDDRFTEFDRMYDEIRAHHGYALTGNLKEYSDMDDNEYDDRLKKAIEHGKNLRKSVRRSETFERKYLDDRISKMVDCEIEFTQLRTRGGLRISPFSVCLFGQSGCGKSSLTSLTINAGLVYNGLSAEKDRIATWADNDKYASSIRSHINAIIFDDFANTKENFMDFSPAYRLIQVINNIKYLAPMADVFLKGKVSLNPWFCVVSTNVEHLNAAVYSNEPESVLRRLKHVKVVPKPEFCTNGILSKEKIEARFGHTPTPDVWRLSIREYQVTNKGGLDMNNFRVIEWRGKAMHNISVFEYLEWLQIASKLHFTEEGQYLANQQGIPTICEECEIAYCKCCKVTPELQEKLEEQSGILRYMPRPLVWWKRYSEFNAVKIRSHYRNMQARALVANSNLCNWWERFDCLPESWICDPRVLKFCLLFWRKELTRSLISGYVFIVMHMLFLMFILPRGCLIWLGISIWLAYYYTCATMQTYQNMVRERMLEVKQVTKAFINSWQLKWALLGLGALGVVYKVFKTNVKKHVGGAYISSMGGKNEDFMKIQTEQYNIFDQSGMNPENIDDIKARDAQSNPWAEVEVSEVPMSPPSQCTTSDNLARAMGTNLIGIVSEENLTTMGFYICSNFVVVPTHYINRHSGEFRIRAYKSGEQKVGGYFRDVISKPYSHAIPGTDFTMCFITSGGSMKDMRKFLVTGANVPRLAARLITRQYNDGTGLASVPTMFEGSRNVTHTSATFWGGYYTLPIDTVSGMCMSPVISAGKGSSIIGFHLGGRGYRGGCGTLTLDQANAAIDALSQVDGVVLSASAGNLTPNMGTLPSKVFDEDVITDKTIHSKSATRFLPFGAFINVFGSTTGKATPYSNVEPTVISEKVEEVFGEPQKWGKPKMRGKGKYPYQASLEHAAVPSLPVGGILARAVRDMKDITVKIKKKIPELFEVGPLSRVVTVSGQIGKRFIDPMNMNTSPGFPLSGPKKNLVVDLDPEDYPDVGKPRTFVKEVWDEFDKAKEMLMKGERCYSIFKACLKDEPTRLDKDKVRVFQSAPIVLQLLVRMYFLPIIRIIQMNPCAYECAVGANAEGPDWEEIWEWAMSKGRERVLAGDYSKYDLRMPAQIVIAAFDVLIDIAEQCSGYTEDDITLMRNMVNEIAYPILAYNGDLIQLFGTNPSGQNLTVIINSLVNSLLLRCCFFTLYPHACFKTACAFLTYGDDVIGTIGKAFPKFTHIAYADWLAKHDMKFTMPDKESTPTPYMREQDVDFLKRKCEYNPDLDAKVGLLAEESIYKRLHSHIVSKELTPEMHSAQNIDSSLHDWFYYGREVFEDRREKLRRVAQESGIEHLCLGLKIGYDRRVAVWKHKYRGEPLEGDIEPVLTEQCGSDTTPYVANFHNHCIGDGNQPWYDWEWYALMLGSFLYIPFMVAIWHGKIQCKHGIPTAGWRLFCALFVICGSLNYFIQLYLSVLKLWGLTYILGYYMLFWQDVYLYLRGKKRVDWGQWYLD